MAVYGRNRPAIKRVRTRDIVLKISIENTLASAAVRTLLNKAESGRMGDSDQLWEPPVCFTLSHAAETTRVERGGRHIRLLMYRRADYSRLAAAMSCRYLTRCTLFSLRDQR